SVEPDEGPARHTIEELGCDQLVFSTDYPHGDSRYPHAVESFLKLLLSDADKRKILWDNCARFYGIEKPQYLSHEHAKDAPSFVLPHVVGEEKGGG
ncbi:MAG TPA: amidohydrolase family protein, partial [Candidatus Binatia bacterium]|nr:amidohydrolase family protein [Candidatus Binatia bacterium]